MKLLFICLVFTFLIAKSASAPPAEVNAPVAESKIPVPCPDLRKAVKLLRGYNWSAGDHFYTTDAYEMMNAINNLGYVNEGYAGRVFTNQERYTTEIYRLWNPWIKDHFYTTSRDEVDDYIYSRHYTYENSTGYLFSTQICNSIPMYRLNHVQAKDHFYTTSADERFYYVQKLGYQYEGILGYILPA